MLLFLLYTTKVVTITQTILKQTVTTPYLVFIGSQKHSVLGLHILIWPKLVCERPVRLTAVGIHLHILQTLRFIFPNMSCGERVFNKAKTTKKLSVDI